LIHFIVALRLKHPRKRIHIAKYDFSDAYRRMTFSSRAANQSILVVGKTAYLFLRITFGGSPNPPAWCAFSGWRHLRQTGLRSNTGGKVW
jgi:hypothetical protein